jgi:hypothetical protein
MSTNDKKDKNMWFGRKIYRYTVKSNCNNLIYQFTSTSVTPDEAILLMDERYRNTTVIYHLICNDEKLKTWGCKYQTKKTITDKLTGEKWTSIKEFAKSIEKVPMNARYHLKKHKNRYIYE